MLRHARSALIAAALTLIGCADPQVDRRLFVERLGDDTMAVEEIVRTPARIEGTLVARSPVTRVARYSADLAPEGRVSRFELEWSTPPQNPDGPPTERYIVDLVGDSATMVHTSSEGSDTTRFELTRDAIPTTRRLPFSVGVWELALRRAIAAGADEYELVLLSPGVPRPARTPLRRFTEDSVSMRVIGGLMRARVDERGRVLGIDGRGSTMGVVIEPARDLDLDSLAAQYASLDARGEGVGTASPGATVTATVAGAELGVTYSRPSMRGREIWGGLVPWGTVWRTGANAATHFTTTKDLRIGDVRLAAGAYTLWSTFAPDSATLIINSQTGQWGTQYDASRDRARVPLSVEELPEAIERFTIEIQPQGERGALLSLTWDRRRCSVPIEVLGP